ncbi:unnamed protein product [Cylindrotheca closterium]|uniref:Uncharacterized protein n=1 Tax=Cylindrotheca closterium TaxID=2856 RepID=A0AAD2FU76_9STRA|nr:unnamed protein product [Cylindrotheca closterium]
MKASLEELKSAMMLGNTLLVQELLEDFRADDAANWSIIISSQPSSRRRRRRNSNNDNNHNREKFPMSMLELACDLDDPEILEMLLQHGANANVMSGGRHGCYETLLHTACRRNKFDLAEGLLDHAWRGFGNYQQEWTNSPTDCD